MRKRNKVKKTLFHDTKRYIIFIFPYVKKYIFSYIMLFMFMFFGVFLSLFMAWFMKHLTDSAIHHEIKQVEFLIFVGFGLFATNSILSFANSYIRTRIVFGMERDMKVDLFRHILRFPVRQMEDYQVGDLVSRVSSDAEIVVNGMVGNVINVIRHPLVAVFGFLYLFQLNQTLTLICVSFGPVALLWGYLLGKFVRPLAKRMQDKYGSMNGFLTESFGGFQVIRAFALERQFTDRFEKDNQSILAIAYKEVVVRGGFRFVTQMGGATLYFLVMGMGAAFVTKGNMSIGTLMAFFSLMGSLTSPFSGMASQLGGFQRALASAERIWKIHDAAKEFEELPFLESAKTTNMNISFENVTFSYEPEHHVLHHFNFEIPSGKTIALVGQSGAGKSTIVNLAAGFYQPVQGSVLFNGIPIDTLSPSEVRSYVAYVSQETFLFSGTIRDNLLYGCPTATDMDMIRASRDASAHEFIVSLPQGYDTKVGERGVRLSGGQRQRIAIARALLKNAPILLMDEPTSALDLETELQLKVALERLMVGRTTLIVAHRLSTIRNADTIVVLDKGKIVEQGNHQELISHGGLYARMAQLQYLEEEQETPDSVRVQS